MFWSRHVKGIDPLFCPTSKRAEGPCQRDRHNLFVGESLEPSPCYICQVICPPKRVLSLLHPTPFLIAILSLGAASLHAHAGSRIQFRIILDPALSSAPVSGRMLVFLSNRPQKQQQLSTSFGPSATWVAAVEVENLEPGGSLLFDPDLKSFPAPFSTAPKGPLQFQALLDTDHSYSYTGRNEGDLQSEVLMFDDIDPEDCDPVEIRLTDRRPPARFEPPANVKIIEFESPMLSKFWGRPILMKASVLLPPSYETDTKRSYATVYDIHGFGGNHIFSVRRALTQLETAMKEGKRPEMVRVYLDASFPTGHHVFADSVNNGPWGAALTREFIPHLEKQFRMVAKPQARFLTGHSSGGWSTLWLQVAYPDFFGGTWSTAPDSVDFRSFTGIDVTPGTTDNAYTDSNGNLKNLVRVNGREVSTLREFVRQEEVTGPVGGQMASFDWVFSPRGPDGRPMRAFNRATGEIDQTVAKAWEAYDIRLVLERNWKTLGPKLVGKLHIVCGSEDTFHLEEAAYMLCDLLTSKGREDACEIVAGRDHGNLYRSHTTYPDGLAVRIEKEMMAAFEKAVPPATPAAKPARITRSAPAPQRKATPAN